MTFILRINKYKACPAGRNCDINRMSQRHSFVLKLIQNMASENRLD